MLAFSQMLFVAQNEAEELTKQRLVCQQLLTQMHQYLCQQAVEYHGLQHQPLLFAKLCERIISLQDFIERIAQANGQKAEVGQDIQSNFIKRVILIIKDNNLREIHFPACKCLLNIDFDQSVLVILDSLIMYVQTAVGEYLDVLVRIFTQLAEQYQGPVIQQLANLVASD